jgi:ubiquinone/menaquinone biosynthesis C-methylase UbiE
VTDTKGKSLFDNLIKYVSHNFGNPHGIGGNISTTIMNIMNQRQYKSVLKNIQLKPDETILDIGFGNGYLIHQLCKQNIPVKIYGIEISNDMFNKVSIKSKQNIDAGKLKLFLENINETSFEQNTFDTIYTVNTFYFWNELNKCFSEIRRILKPNGIFMNVIYTKQFFDRTVFSKYGFNKYTVEEIETITKNNGLEIIRIMEIQKNKSYCIISENAKSE